MNPLRMSGMAETVFAISLVCAAYVYAVYPLLLMVWSRLAPRPVRKHYMEPSVTLVIAMHNECGNVKARMRNCMELDYPRDRLQVIVSLDSPTDGTDALLEEYAARGVLVLPSLVRKGKADVLNRGVAAATGEIVVFGDARQTFDPRAVRELVANFADKSVGAVSGELILLDADGTEATDAIGIYWRYEKALRSMESAIHSVTGMTGALYAIRRELYVPLQPGALLDDVLIPARIILQGKRSVFDPSARVYDRATRNPKLEYIRKRRTLTGNYELFTDVPQLLMPWRNPIALQFMSHKAGRLIVPWCLAAMLFSNLILLRGLFRVTLACQILVYLLGLAGLVMSGRGQNEIGADRRAALTRHSLSGLAGRTAMMSYTFLLMNWAVIAGLYCFLRGHDGVWAVSSGATLKASQEGA